jgi:hypothetical protein
MHEPNRCSVRGRAAWRVAGWPAGLPRAGGLPAAGPIPGDRAADSSRIFVGALLDKKSADLKLGFGGASQGRARIELRIARREPETGLRSYLTTPPRIFEKFWACCRGPAGLPRAVRVAAGMSTAPATADREFIPRGARLGMESVARAVGGNVVANLQAKLRSQDRREIQELLVADDRATQVVDADERAQPGA